MTVVGSGPGEHVRFTTEWKDRIDKMSHLDMAKLYRFAPAGHIVFVNPTIYDHFIERFRSFGGMTPAISKAAGL